MGSVFEVIDKSKRKVHLTKEKWEHITTVHSEMTNYLDELQKTIENPLKIIFQEKETEQKTTSKIQEISDSLTKYWWILLFVLFILAIILFYSITKKKR